MEENLREAACMGNLFAVQKLLRSGVSINSQNSINGWTALHWACKRGHLSVVAFLLQSGANASMQTNKGEHSLTLTTSLEIRELLETHSSAADTLANIGESAQKQIDQFPITPNYLKNPVFPYYDVKVDENEAMANNTITRNPAESSRIETGVSKLAISDSTTPGVTFKVRVEERDEDFVEVELSSFSYQSLFTAVCEELELAPSNVANIRKLPNVLVRKDKDVLRLKEGQELEVVLNSTD